MAAMPATTKSPSFQWLVVVAAMALRGDGLAVEECDDAWIVAVVAQLHRVATGDDATRVLVQHDAVAADGEDALQLVAGNHHGHAEARIQRQDELVQRGPADRV